MHSYVLMGNHYHMLLETPEPNLSTGMQWLQSIYTIRHNVKHRLRGHLFQGRYKAIPVDGEDWTYFRTVSDYIYLNPARALEKSAHGRPEPSKPVLLRCCRTAGHQKTCQEVRNVNRHGLTPLATKKQPSHPSWQIRSSGYSSDRCSRNAKG